MRVRVLIVVVGVAALVAAAPSDDVSPDELVRRGNEAFHREDYDAAERFYKLAAERTADPGLVAFNAAAVHLKHGDARDAELNYVRALDDRAAPADRRARALYNRGVCLLTRGGPASVYRSAIACFEQALDTFPPDGELARQARHNLEVAKLQWGKARATERKPPVPNELPPDVPEPPRPLPENGGTDAGTEPEGPGGAPTPDRTAGPPAGKAPRPTPQRAPGAGNLPVLLDGDKTQPLSPEDTKAILKQLGERLDHDRRATARLTAGPERPDVLDW